ncbi:TIGR02281 family clan AA aspartic protease [Haliea atlantica]
MMAGTAFFPRTALLLVALLLVARVSAQPPVAVQVEALLPNTAVLMINGQRKTLRAGDSFQGVTLVSADARAAVLEIDGKRQTVGLNRMITTQYVTPDKRQVDIPRNNRNQYVTTARINGRTAPVIVDTGANIVAMNSGQAERLGIDYRSGSPSRVETASDVVDAWVVKLDSVEVGGIRVDNVRASVMDGNFPATILLGMTYLEHVELQEKDGVLSLSRGW